MRDIVAQLVWRAEAAKDESRFGDEGDFLKAAEEIDRLRAVILNIQSQAETGFPIDGAKLATRCRKALALGQSEKD